MLAAMVAVALCAQAEAPKKWTVHEWGTFTSVSDGRGGTVQWAPFLEQSDLPAFVHSGFRFVEGFGKGGIYANVRMETPVIYFYSDEDVLASVRVRMPAGSLTEWYPSVLTSMPAGDSPDVHQQHSDAHLLDWGAFKVLPHAHDALPDEHKPSHYYAAREVDAAEVNVCTREGGKAAVEREKFLFYRGVGTFQPPLSASFDARARPLVRVDNGEATTFARPRGSGGLDAKGFSLTPRENLGEALVFERQGDQVGLKRVMLDGERHVDRVASGSSVEEVKAALVERLVAAGLYEKEAKAMVKTWNDSWFEPGLRVFYVEPAPMVEEQLPLEVAPAPRERVRVIVGRLELFSPARVDAVLREVAEAKARHAEYELYPPMAEVFAKEGRFLDAILAVAAAGASPAERTKLQQSRGALMGSVMSTRQRAVTAIGASATE
ncbi:MAG: hypothetical protein QM723_21720 [Myxococcaceae bacterium]